MAVANHPLCEPVRFAHYKALVPIREVDGIVCFRPRAGRYQHL